MAPFKPIGQLMTLAELHAVRAAPGGDAAARAVELEEMNALLDRAAMLGAARSPMPVYSNDTNCSNCHIGGLPGRYGEDLDEPYPGAGTWTAKPGPPPFKSDAPVSCD